MPRNVDIRSSKDLLEFQKYVGKVEKGMRRKLNKGLKEAVRPTLLKTQLAAQQFPATGSHHTGLRNAVARSLAISASRGNVRISVRRGKMPEGKENLPNRMEGIGGKWRHPLFGDTEHWYAQPQHPWFYPTVKGDLEEVRMKISKVTDDIAKELEHL